MDVFWIKSSLDNAGNERSELWFLPSESSTCTKSSPLKAWSFSIRPNRWTPQSLQAYRWIVAFLSRTSICSRWRWLWHCRLGRRQWWRRERRWASTVRPHALCRLVVFIIVLVCHPNRRKRRQWQLSQMSTHMTWEIFCRTYSFQAQGTFAWLQSLLERSFMCRGFVFRPFTSGIECL